MPPKKRKKKAKKNEMIKEDAMPKKKSILEKVLYNGKHYYVNKYKNDSVIFEKLNGNYLAPAGVFSNKKMYIYSTESTKLKDLS